MAHPDYIREKAIQLRIEKKLTIDEIAERLSLSKTTVYYWVGHIEIPRKPGLNAMAPAHLAKAQQLGNAAMQAKYREIREKAYQQGLEEFDDLSRDPTFRDFVCMYVGEGSKKNRNTVAICNSDPLVVKLGNKWITRFSRNPVGYAIQHHADQDLGDLRDFWADHLAIGKDDISFLRKSNSGKLAGRNWRSKYGVLTVRASDTRLRARIGAWMDLVKVDWE